MQNNHSITGNKNIAPVQKSFLDVDQSSVNLTSCIIFTSDPTDHQVQIINAHDGVAVLNRVFNDSGDTGRTNMVRQFKFQQQAICVMTSYRIPEHPSRLFLDQTPREHSGGLVGLYRVVDRYGGPLCGKRRS